MIQTESFKTRNLMSIGDNSKKKGFVISETVVSVKGENKCFGCEALIKSQKKAVSQFSSPRPGSGLKKSYRVYFCESCADWMIGKKDLIDQKFPEGFGSGEIKKMMEVK